jgi:putative ABC transport system permease protein
MNEIEQLATMSRILPTIFLVVSAFLTNMVLGRLIATERAQIGLLKAFGYRDAQIAAHYAKLVLGIALVGIVLGTLLGSWLGHVNTRQYAAVFRFPLLVYRPSAGAFAMAACLSVVAAFAGAATAVLRAAWLPPAQAMLPPAPPLFRHRHPGRPRAGAWVDQPTRIILRNIVRWPHRSALTVGGVAASVGLLVLALQWTDSIDYLAETYFFQAQRQHVLVGLADTKSTTVVRDFDHLPGVLAAEPMRIVGADFAVGTARHRGSLTGVAEAARLQPIYDDVRHEVIPPPRDGLVLGAALAEKLGVAVGDVVDVQVLEGRRPRVRLPVVETIETWIGMPAWLHIGALDRLLKERPSAEYVSLLIDRRREGELYRQLKDLPMVSAVMLRQAAIDSFYATIAEHLMVFVSMFSALACTLGFGVAYNSTRIALSERGRELATLRVLGFGRAETGYILLGEVAFLVVLALPLGCLLGSWLAALMASMFRTELYRVPLTIEPSTYGVAVLIALVSTGASAVVVGRRLGRLNLIEVLKTRE